MKFPIIASFQNKHQTQALEQRLESSGINCETSSKIKLKHKIFHTDVLSVKKL